MRPLYSSHDPNSTFLHGLPRVRSDSHCLITHKLPTSAPSLMRKRLILKKHIAVEEQNKGLDSPSSPPCWRRCECVNRTKPDTHIQVCSIAGAPDEAIAIHICQTVIDVYAIYKCRLVAQNFDLYNPYTYLPNSSQYVPAHRCLMLIQMLHQSRKCTFRSQTTIRTSKSTCRCSSQQHRVGMGDPLCSPGWDQLQASEDPARGTHAL